MASFLEMLFICMYAITSLIELMVTNYACGPIIDYFGIWISQQPIGLLKPALVQNQFGIFYGMELIVTFMIFVEVYLTIIKRVDYETGEDTV